MKVEETIQTFLKGFDEFDPEIIAKAWHEQGTLQFISDNGYQIISITKYYESLLTIKANPEHLFHKGKGIRTFIDIDVCGTAARAKLKWEFPDFIFTDFYSLLQIDDRWQIVTKVWHKEMK